MYDLTDADFPLLGEKSKEAGPPGMKVHNSLYLKVSHRGNPPSWCHENILVLASPYPPLTSSCLTID